MSQNHPKNLRQRAAEILRGKPVDMDTMSPQEIERVFYELQLHEIELQLQNEELRTAQHQLEESRQKYADLYDFAPVGYLTLTREGMVTEANLTITKMLDMGREQLFRSPFVTHVRPAQKTVFLDHQQRLLSTQTPQRDEVQLVKGDGTSFFAQLDSIVVPPIANEPGQYRMVITDITQRKRIERAEYEQRIFAEALHVISKALNSTLDLDEVLALILANVNHVIQHHAAEVMLFEKGIARIVGSTGYTEHELLHEIGELSIDETPNLAQMMRTGKTVLVSDIYSQPAWNTYLKEKDMHSYVGAPIHLADQVIGCLNVFNRLPGFYTEKHAERLQAFANQTATAINNAQLHKHMQEVAVLQERQRLARDLHDAVSQTLFSATIIAEALPRLSYQSPEALTKNLGKLLALTRGAMAEMRTLLLELRPGQLERYTVSELLQQLAEALHGRKQIAVDLHLANDLRERYPHLNIFDIHEDIRTYGRGHEEYYTQASANRVRFLRFHGDERPDVLPAPNGDSSPLLVRVKDYLTWGEELDVPADLVVLATGILPNTVDDIINLLKISAGTDRFLLEVHPKLQPVETAVPGVVLAGTAQGPMNIQEASAAASAAAAKVAVLLGQGSVTLQPFVARVNHDLCDGSGECVAVCAYEDAITLQMISTNGHTAQKAVVTPANCVGCGVCVSACPNHAIDVQGWTMAQYEAMLDALAAPLPVLESAT